MCFLQFETVSLEAMLYMLDLFNVSSDDRRSPIQVSKALTEMVSTFAPPPPYYSSSSPSSWFLG